ncbi:uncharacterized protein LOC111626481 [Centruroides sculpturatus]|uniref:uncharacterized protein LOC111626481 n=1 Tax=Centruroides sculpturatus TaxID=218467 RepID=UPI000C6CAC01|nr:uncharacterized protein LOC111626481 [Centruroides sculpturatus]
MKNIKMSKNYRLASLDIKNMYPSITWNLIESTLKKIEAKEEVMDLIEFVYRSNYFEVNNKFYTQQTGISMGSVIGPKLAELVMVDIDQAIKKFTGIKFYKRYVDDIIILYDQELTKLEEIEEKINKLNDNIKFKVENEANTEINYLDIKIIRKENRIEFEPYTKPCEIRKVLNYNSNIPQYIKENIFIMEYKKIENRTSSLPTKEKHLNELRTKFLLNGYPKRMLNNWERKMNNKRLENKQNKRNTVRYIPFPYIHGFFEQVNKSFDKINIKLAPTYNNLQKRIRKTVPNRNKQKNKYSTTEVVYKIPCTCKPPKVYIGETKRKLETRLKEHIADLKYNRINSVFYEHCTTHNCKIDKNHATIVHKEKNWYKRRFKESYEITIDKNNINKNLSIDIHKNWLQLLK